MDSDQSLLIIFYRNPAIGTVKTRLANTLGDAKALAVYLYLAAHTKAVTESLSVDKAVFYSTNVDTEDNWSNVDYQKFVQTGNTLGQRMANAFREGFRSGYKSICIIGTDCFELSSEVIEAAFIKLQSLDAVIGPAKDGGYYLLGLNSFDIEFFENKVWSTNSVFAATIHDFNTKGLRYYQLPVLTDVDEENDLPDELSILL